MRAARAQSSSGSSFPDGFPHQISWDLAGLGLNFAEGLSQGHMVAIQPGEGILGGAASQDTVLDFCTRAVIIPATSHTLEAAPVDNSTALPKKCFNSIHHLGRTNVHLTLLYFSTFPLQLSIPVSFLFLSTFTFLPMCSFSHCILLEHELWAIFSEDMAAVVGPLVFSLSFSVPF